MTSQSTMPAPAGSALRPLPPPTRPDGGLRSRVKHAAERAALAGGVARMSRARMRGRALVLAYHNVIPRGEHAAGDRSLHLPQQAFAAQLDALCETHEIVALPALLRPASGDRPRAAITFDDAYRGALTAGVEELCRRGLPATVFVAPGLLGSSGFWWDAVTAPGAEAPSAALRERILEEGRGHGADARRIARAQGLAEHPLPPHARPADESELRVAAGRPGITLAAHSWTHPNLTALDEPELLMELRAPLSWLRERFPERVVPWLAYPYGLWSHTVARAAAGCGYAAAVRVDGGWMDAEPPDRLALPRLNVASGLSADGFLLRAAGLRCG